jgi:tetratricopeptide (TPR) repeat protein
MRSALARTLAGIAAAALIAGCGDRTLWERYRTERALFRIERALDHIRHDPRAVSDKTYARVSARLRAIVDRDPPAVWAKRAQSPGTARDVAILSGRASLTLASLDELRGNHEVAASEYQKVLDSWSGVLPVALEAAAGRARCLAAAGAASSAAVAWTSVWRDFPSMDPERGEPLAPVLEAPIQAAAWLERAGRKGSSDSLLDAATRRLALEIPRASGRAAGGPLCLTLADVRGARGDVLGELAALRQALGERSIEKQRPRMMLALASRALEGGRPDTALAYARWAEQDLFDEDRGTAMLLDAEAWRALGKSDSALAAYSRFLDRSSAATDSAALARFRRGTLLESVGRWDQARSEFHELAATFPTHELGFAALIQVVRHHAERGESELARIEGRRALENLDRMMAMHFDPKVQASVGLARGEVLAATGDLQSACAALQDVWKRTPATPAGATAGLRAAAIAESSLTNRKLAVELYRDVAARAAESDARRRARAALERLERKPSAE